MPICENCGRPTEIDDENFCLACNKPITRIAKKAKDRGGQAFEKTIEGTVIATEKAKRVGPVLKKTRGQVGGMVQRLGKKISREG